MANLAELHKCNNFMMVCVSFMVNLQDRDILPDKKNLSQEVCQQH